MRIISWNTNGLRATAKQGNLLPLFGTLDPDIVCLQETKAEAEQLPDEVKLITGYVSHFYSSKVKKGYSGVGVYTKYPPFSISGLGIKEFDDEGRTLVLDYGSWVLINCYFPNGGAGPVRLDYKLRFYDAFLEFCEKFRKEGKSVVFCGDINTAHHSIDLARPKENEENMGFLPIERAWLDEVENHGYVDVFRHFYPDTKDAYTYWDQKTAARERNVGWRIDYFFVSSDLLHKLKANKILTDYYGSDHCPIVLDIDI